MLQQGRFAADILYYYGQDTNLTALYRSRSPNLPRVYDFDYVNADALIHVLGVNSDGEITTPGKVTYRILGLNQNSQHFSGTGTYTGTAHASSAWLRRGAHIWINLGEVKNLAEVSVNGKPLGIVWHTPYKVDATLALHPGNNTLAIKVTNSWVNRLIGDQQPDAVKRILSLTIIHAAPVLRCCLPVCLDQLLSIRLQPSKGPGDCV